MRLRFSLAAERDLEGIGDYLASDNPRRAPSFVAELRRQCRALLDFPNAAPAAPELGRGVRKLVCRDYLVFYLVQDEEIMVLRVVHGARRRPAVD